MSHGTFATVIGCMDGRCQEKAYAYAKEQLGAEHIDTITEPGVDGILAGVPHPVLSEAQLAVVREVVQAKAGISAKGHGSTKCLVMSHCECAGNPVDLPTHEAHLKKAKETVESWGLFNEVTLAAFTPEWEIVAVGT
jgi:hypothetical protein